MGNIRRIATSLGILSSSAAGFAGLSALVKNPKFFEHNYVAPMTAVAPYSAAVGTISIASAGLLAATKQYKLATIAATAGVVALHAGQYKVLHTLPRKKHIFLEKNDVRVYVHNILTENKDQGKKLAEQIVVTNPDIVVITEANRYSINNANAVLGQYLYQGWENLGSEPVLETNKKFYGIFVASKFPITNFESIEECGRVAVSCLLQIGDTQVRFIAGHTSAPISKRLAGQWVKELDALNRYIKRVPLDNEHIIVVGDFNATIEHAPFRALVKNNDLVDVSDSAPTWPAKNIGTRRVPMSKPVLGLDHILVSRNIVPIRVQTADSASSDHLSLIADLRIF